MSSASHGQFRRVFILRARENEDWDVGCCANELSKRLNPVTVGQRKVQQDRRDAGWTGNFQHDLLGQHFKSGEAIPDTNYAERLITRIDQRVSNGSAVRIAILDEEYFLQCPIPRTKSLALQFDHEFGR